MLRPRLSVKLRYSPCPSRLWAVHEACKKTLHVSAAVTKHTMLFLMTNPFFVVDYT
jgi:hypothetical protein